MPWQKELWVKNSAKDIAEIWLKTPFLGERHSRRVEMFEQD